MERITLHFVGGDSRSRAEQARVAFALGHHAEIYGEMEELLAHPPSEGMVIVADDGQPDAARRIIAMLGDAGLWLPLVLTAHSPATDRVVAAIKAGALDYWALPLDTESFGQRLNGIVAEAAADAARRRREVEAQHAVSLLSRREREVLELLSAGCSNKEIARNLEISPRTVEIHRGNMMAKLGAGHPADAVRLWMDSHEEGAFAAAAGDERPREWGDGNVARFDERRAMPHLRLVRRHQRQ